MKNKKKNSDIFAYLQGYYRYHLYYNKYWSWLIRKHIREQIQWRISVMDIECFEKGSCKMCGCDTTALQMANKACPKPCYLAMMHRKDWERHKSIQEFLVHKEFEIMKEKQLHENFRNGKY